MKRRNFLGIVGAGTAMAAASIGVAARGQEQFAHSPEDYAQVQEEPEEFQEFDVDLSDEEFAQDINWE